MSDPVFVWTEDDKTKLNDAQLHTRAAMLSGASKALLHLLKIGPDEMSTRRVLKEINEASTDLIEEHNRREKSRPETGEKDHADTDTPTQ